MSVRRLLAEVDSYELSCWLVYLSVDADHQRAEAAQRKEDRRLLGDDQEVIRDG
jgi:hypothetical protein